MAEIELVGYRDFEREELKGARLRVHLFEKYRFQRRPASKTFKGQRNHIYVGKAFSSNIRGQVEKCKKLLDTKFDEVHLHALGYSIPRAMEVARAVKDFYNGCVDYKTQESTKILIDDLIPVDEETVPSQKTRNVAEIQIQIFKTVQLPY